MCYGGLDVKYVVADIEARAKGVAFAGANAQEPRAPGWAAGILARLRRPFARRPVHRFWQKVWS